MILFHNANLIFVNLFRVFVLVVRIINNDLVQQHMVTRIDRKNEEKECACVKENDLYINRDTTEDTDK